MSKFLIVDDALIMREYIREIVERLGHEVVGMASNGKQAIKKYEQLAPDFVTMDITMPLISGIQALQTIITMDQRAKVIMITALGQQKIIDEAYQNGAIYVLQKPFQDKQLQQLIERYTEI